MMWLTFSLRQEESERDERDPEGQRANRWRRGRHHRRRRHFYTLFIGIDGFMFAREWPSVLFTVAYLPTVFT